MKVYKYKMTELKLIELKLTKIKLAKWKINVSIVAHFVARNKINEI